MPRRKRVLSILIGLVAILVLASLVGCGKEEKDIVETAIADGRFETLVAALEAVELDDTLKGEGPYTVFAPTDDAFDKLPDGTVEALLNDIPTLKDILLYHVVAGKVMAKDVECGNIVQ